METVAWGEMVASEFLYSYASGVPFGSMGVEPGTVLLLVPCGFAGKPFEQPVVKVPWSFLEWDYPTCDPHTSSNPCEEPHGVVKGKLATEHKYDE